MNPSSSLQIPSESPRPVSAAVIPAQPPSSSSRRQQRGASHTVVSQASQGQSEAQYTDVYSHPAAVAYATAHPRRTIPKFGPYLLLQTLGEGEFGKVKLGLHSQWGEEVAVKLIRRGNVDTSVRMSKVEREIEVLKSLKHPNIVRLYDVIETDKYIGIILEYASGGELFDHILAHRYLRERDAARLFSQLISGVWYIHQKKIVHRDLKLENLLLDRHRNVIITDFGFANRFEHRADDLMQTSCGSPCYAAPELVISEGLYVGSAVDIWSCGVILYAMLAGYLPFDDDPANPDGDNINLLYKYIVNTPLSFPEYISAEARDLLGMMLVPDPTRRSSLDAVMRHPWLAAYALPKDGLTLPSPGTPNAFGRSVDQLERQALDQHQQRRLAYQRQMRAAAQAQASQQGQAQHSSRSQSHHVHPAQPQPQTSSNLAATARHASSQPPEFLYDSSVDLSIASPPPVSAPVSSSRRGQHPLPVLGGDDDPFGPPPSSVGRAVAAEAQAPSPKGHKSNGGGGEAGGFRHTIQVEYDDPRTHARGRSGGASSSGRRSDEQQQQQHQQQGRSNGVGAEPQAQPPKERRPSQSGAPSKPLPSTPPASASHTHANGNTTPASYRGVRLPTPPASAPLSSSATGSTSVGSNSHRRTPSTPIQVHQDKRPQHQTPDISINVASPPATPRASAHPARQEVSVFEEEEHDRGTGRKTRVSLDRIGLGKVFGHGQGSASESAAASEKSTGTSASGRSASRSSVLLSPAASGASVASAASGSPSVGDEKESKDNDAKEQKDGKERDGKEKDGKKSRRNTLTVMVEPFRSTIRNRGKGRNTSSSGGGEPVSASTANASTTSIGFASNKDSANSTRKASPQPPHSALSGTGTGGKSSAGPVSSYAGAQGEIGTGEGGDAEAPGLQASTSKARKVMAWFRSKSKVREVGGLGEEEGRERERKRSITPTQGEYVHVQSPNANASSREEKERATKDKENTPAVVVTSPNTGLGSRTPSVKDRPQRTPSTATADTTFTIGTPSLVSRFRNSVTIGGGANRSHQAHNEHSSRAHTNAIEHPWGVLRTHHGAVDQSTVTTKPPPEVIRHVRRVLEGMGVEIFVESEYKYRCVRPKRRKAITLGAVSTPPPGAGVISGEGATAGGSLAAVTMVGSAASNGVDKRGLPAPAPSSFTATGGMLRGLLMRRQSSQVSNSGLASPLDDDVSSPLIAEPGAILGATAYGDPAQDAGDEVKFSVELTRIDRLNDTFSLDIRRMKGNLRSYKFLYDTLRE
ncbi:hypothetical protein DXG03_001385 [Asterophora parasitica]|uniref:Non-specific serine/threonine protein kinase n=1 Tax=Asterophora parasitica TaxID=117018 RepID=A0A9P7K994_9AGAR|nr:hypothetical protein DXG03_001385 [Asterophora parasitica]